jgi:hypothetical protein
MANQYGVIFTHPPNVCPISNKASREMAKKGFAELPNISQKYKVKMIAYYHFDPGHLAVGIFESENSESLRDMLVESGFMHWCDMTIYPITPVEKILQAIDKIPTIY